MSNEHELEAVLDYTFRRRGGSGPAYATIVGGGANATVLHYITNDQKLNDGEVVLVDAGCELEGYVSDVTRTFPIGGRFGKAERAQVFDQTLHHRHFLKQEVQVGLVRIVDPVEHRLDFTSHDGQRRPELMTEIGKQLTPLLICLFQPASHRVERARELALLVFQLGFNDASDVMARELHATAQTQAALRLRTIQPYEKT